MGEADFCEFLWGIGSEIELGSGNIISLQQKTTYPENEKVLITVNPKRSEQFELILRIPKWSEQSKITVYRKEWEQGSRYRIWINKTLNATRMKFSEY